MAKGMKLCVAGRSANFVTFRKAANSAALPGVVEVKRMYDAARVWMLVSVHVHMHTCRSTVGYTHYIIRLFLL